MDNFCDLKSFSGSWVSEHPLRPSRDTPELHKFSKKLSRQTQQVLERLRDTPESALYPCTPVQHHFPIGSQNPKITPTPFYSPVTRLQKQFCPTTHNLHWYMTAASLSKMGDSTATQEHPYLP